MLALRAKTPYLLRCRSRRWRNTSMKNVLLAPVLAWLGRLRHPQLFVVAAVVFVIDLIVPDFVPFADEILLAATTVWLGSRKARKNRPLEPESPAE
jgi:hypothetical protein